MNKVISPGTIIGHYRVISQLGAGGMGEVYLAQDTKLDRRVALKILSEEFAGDPERMRRFVQEAKSASALNHPNIITIHEIGDCERSNFIATEYVKGETLSRRLRGESMSLGSTLEVAIQIASALQAAHDAGIVHRDIKPDNVMIRPDGFVKLLDFGIAKLTEKNREPIDEEAATAISAGTSPGMIVGTAAYMSPEQARGKQIDARTDIFSFGVVLYEMLTLRHPFEGENAMDVIGSILHKEPAPIRQLLPDVPQDIERLINKTLRKDREERYQTAKDLLIDLKDARQELALQTRLERTSPPNREEPSTQIIAATSADVPHTTSSAEYLVSEITKRKRGIAIGLMVLVLALIGLGYWLFGNRATPAKQIESIAVMPFVNESGNADVEYLSDGMTETLISSLSQLPNLNVKPRSTVFRYKGKQTDPKAVGKELSVEAILIGRVIQHGADVSLFVELIEIALDKVIWSQQYNRKQTDLVTLQTDIARDVSNRLKSKLSGAEEARVTKTYTTDPEAYQLYLKGNFYLTKYTEEGYQKGLEYYQKALEIDPNYALAYHEIAEAYHFANDWYLSPKEAMPKAKAAALKALELDETLAGTHYLLGKIVFWYEWDWPAAEREWKRANELDPTYPAYYPVYLAALGRFDEALTDQESVQRRLPLDLNVNMDTAGILLSAGQTDRSMEQTRKALELDPNFWWAHQNLGLAYERKKQYAEAIAALEKACSVDNSPSNLGYLGAVYGIAGKDADAKRVLGELKEISKRRYVSPYNMAVVYAGLNDKDQAFGWLDRAWEARSFGMTQLRVETVLDNLRDDPRYRVLLKRMGLPE